jgi:hypothetical protein
MGEGRSLMVTKTFNAPTIVRHTSRSSSPKPRRLSGTTNLLISAFKWDVAGNELVRLGRAPDRLVDGKQAPGGSMDQGSDVNHC